MDGNEEKLRTTKKPHVVVIGAGFCGLAAAFELSKRGVRVTVVEKNEDIGGLARSFPLGETELEVFYHHWFRSDKHALGLARELGVLDRVRFKETRTATYCSGELFSLYHPFHLLKFKPLHPLDRFRVGLLTLRAQLLRNWKELESQLAEQWLIRKIGSSAYNTLWKPLLYGKFADFAPEISAVWLWNKFKLRGGSRGKKGQETLGYYAGSFAAFANRIKEYVEAKGGSFITRFPVEEILVAGNRVTGLKSGDKIIRADMIIATPPLPVTAGLIKDYVSPDYTRRLQRIKYLGNICVVLELKHRLSKYYWINVNSEKFPFVGIVEHTNFQPARMYGGRHIVYLTKYLPPSDPLFSMDAKELMDLFVSYLSRIFPSFKPDWIRNYHVWKARYTQPIVERHYSKLIPSSETPLEGFYISSMAQIYPEDRGTNYAIREGRAIGEKIARKVTSEGKTS